MVHPNRIQVFFPDLFRGGYNYETYINPVHIGSVNQKHTTLVEKAGEGHYQQPEFLEVQVTLQFGHEAQERVKIQLV